MIDELKAQLRKIEEEIEKSAEKAREIESKGQTLPKGFWDHLDNCVDELNSVRSSLSRLK